MPPLAYLLISPSSAWFSSVVFKLLTLLALAWIVYESAAVLFRTGLARRHNRKEGRHGAAIAIFSSAWLSVTVR
jgi:hypothetical protein